MKGRLGQMHALVVLDDVHSNQTSQLGLLVPPPPCATLITSRIRDIARIPANAMHLLDRMTPDQARELLASILGNERFNAERECADSLAERVCYNPLALDISARLIKRMAQDGVANPIAAFYSRVKDRLKDIKIGEGERESLFACIGLSYEDLSQQNQSRLYRLAAFHPTGFSVDAAAALWGSTFAKAHNVLERFVNLSLLKHVNADRFRFCDLVDELALSKLPPSAEDARVKIVSNTKRRELGTPSLINTNQYYSCFISYSSKDQDFACRLHADLQCRGLRVWFAPEDIKIGDRLDEAIDKAVHLYDKLMVVLSSSSIESIWVEREVKTALAKEKPGKAPVLFPLRLDDAVMSTTQQWAHDIKRNRHIGDFSNWKEHDAYQKAFERLLRDLKAEDTPPI